MNKKGWYDNYQNEIVRNNKDGNIYYDSISKGQGHVLVYGNDYETYVTTKITSLEVYLKALELSKKKLTPELKQVIDDLTVNELNDVIGLTQYTQKTPLGHAIDSIHLEAVDYLLSLGVDTSISGPNQKHILQELLASNATEKRVQILDMVLDTFNDIIPLESNYDGKYYSIKYLIPLINKMVISRDDLLNAYDNFKTAQKKQLVTNCPIMSDIAIQKGDEIFYPQEVKDIFLF